MGMSVDRTGPTRWRRVQSTALAVGLLGAMSAADLLGSADAQALGGGRKAPSTSATGIAVTALPATFGAVREERLSSPDRVVVRDDVGVVATFATGARTVTVRGNKRTFAESTTSATVTTTTWVRLLGTPFTGSVDYGWLAARLTDTSDDVLEIARQYVTGAPQRTDATGLRVAGDASYGPLLADGTRQEGADFNDYLGLPWTYASGVDQAEDSQYGAIDCSGYIRTIFGYRGGMALTLQPDGVGLPRRAVQMNDSAPGVMVVPYTGARPSKLDRLLPGDLVFFDASTDDGPAIDHAGIYLGVDSAGAPRFVSSRKSADGPTMGDIRGKSVLSGSGLYATSFRSARRL